MSADSYGAYCAAGTIKDVTMKPFNATARQPATMRAYVDFQTHDQAAAALAALNNSSASAFCTSGQSVDSDLKVRCADRPSPAVGSH